MGAQVKVTPKIEQLKNSKHGPEVDAMLAAGKSPHTVRKYLASQGFEISVPTLYKYDALRKAGALRDDPDTGTAQETETKARLLTELKALDTLIEKGYQAVVEMEPEKVTPRLLMEAIRLKCELTGGEHAFLTEYGYSTLKALDNERWRAVVPYVLSFIREDRQEEVMRGIEEIEEGIYRNTPWYDEYRKGKTCEYDETGKASA